MQKNLCKVSKYSDQKLGTSYKKYTAGHKGIEKSQLREYNNAR